jgi:hypothetical protein
VRNVLDIQPAYPINAGMVNVVTRKAPLTGDPAANRRASLEDARVRGVDGR